MSTDIPASLERTPEQGQQLALATRRSGKMVAPVESEG